MVVEFEAGGAERRRMEFEDARGANATIHATNLYVVEKPPVLGAAAATCGLVVVVGDSGIERRDGGSGFYRRRVHSAKVVAVELSGAQMKRSFKLLI